MDNCQRNQRPETIDLYAFRNVNFANVRDQLG
jgi:hypothetical protein